MPRISSGALPTRPAPGILSPRLPTGNFEGMDTPPISQLSGSQTGADRAVIRAEVERVATSASISEKIAKVELVENVQNTTTETVSSVDGSTEQEVQIQQELEIYKQKKIYIPEDEEEVQYGGDPVLTEEEQKLAEKLGI